MDKSPVSGVAGAVRIEKLSLSKLREAERHGKRENESGKSRVVRDAPPVTTTGLDLEALYEAHVEGAFVPKGKNLAIEVLVQFPKDLVDGSDGGYLLAHARRFVESVWGPQSIFGDRCDRDEKGVTNVSVFIAPKYIKKTKRTEKVSVSLTRDLKRLVSEKTNNEEEAHKWAIGRALQDAIFEYFRDVMKLPGVQRGDPKASPGPDWKSAEELREQELEAMKAEHTEQLKMAAEERDKAERLSRQADAERSAARALLEEARLALQAEREQFERDRELHHAQVALIARAADDQNGLHLRSAPKGVFMTPSRMTDDEKAIFYSNWPPVIVEIARHLAAALERVRQTLLQLADRETRIERKEAEVSKNERQLEEQRRSHAEAVRLHELEISDFDARIRQISAKETELDKNAEDARIAAETARAKQASADAIMRSQSAWADAIKAIKPESGRADIGSDGRIAIDANLRATLPDAVVTTLTQQAPEWVRAIVAQGCDIAVLKDKAAKQVAKAQSQAQAASAKLHRINRSHDILTDIVTKKCVASANNRVLTLDYSRPGTAPRVERVQFDDVEPFLLAVAETYHKFGTLRTRVVALKTELQQEREALAKKHPERAPDLERDQAAVEAKVTNAFRAPPGWGDGIGR